MKYTIKDYELELIDDPMQKQVIAWEKATRALKTADAKPILEELQDTFRTVDVEHFQPAVMFEAFIAAMRLLGEAIKILEANETLTSTANHGVMVKAALQTGWIVSFTKAGKEPEDTRVPVLTSADDVDNAKPWLMTWAAVEIATVYNEATSIPKN